MTYRTSPWRHLLDQTRLYIAEQCLMLAVVIAPERHPDSEAIQRHVHAFALERCREGTVEVDWRGRR